MSKIHYARWHIPAAAKSHLPELEQGLSANVHNDLNWMESELSDGREWLLPGKDVTAADIMNVFNIDFIFTKRLGIDGGSGWPHVRKWLERCKGQQAYQNAVQRSGYSL